MSKLGIYGENTDVAHIAGSDGWPLVGNTFKYLLNTYGFGKAMRQTYGEVYRSRAFFLRFIVLSSPDGIEYVLRDEAQNFSSKLGWEPFLARLFPNALPTMDFEEHRFHRKIMQSVFRHAAMQSYAGLINDVVIEDVEKWREQGVVKVYPGIKAIMLDIAAKAFLGIDLKKDAEFINQTFITINNGLAPIIPSPLPGTAIWKALRARQTLFDYFRPMIKQRKASDGKDIFTRLCQAKDEEGAEFSEQAILDHLVNVLSAAHDTSTTSLTIAMYYLAKHPEWQERLRAVSNGLPEGAVDYSSLEMLEEHEWVFKEALRIYPPAPQLFRRSINACEFKGYKIPANTQVMVDVGYTHRSAEYWSNPMDFDPERFSADRAEHKRHKYQWAPFGGGAHICIGMQFAMMAAKITLHHLLKRYKFELDCDENVDFTILPITQPKNGLPVRVIPLMLQE
ncbi:MAG: cytochrome P450 [Hahellaceae bacterium]|nr:cytochrome P450 [Hahellaceae bacterium]MCP5211452.1 cytochrome P450 [Hahellaceae bacterium]